MNLRKTFAVVALALCLLPFAAAAPLLDPDEGLHAAIAQEMVLRHDYVTPTFLGEPFLDKPILFFWAEAASLRFAGMNEAAVRLPPVVFGLLGMLTVALLGRAMLGEEAGLFGGIVYGTMLLPASLMEIAVHDVALTPFLCVAALAVWRSASGTAADTRATAINALVAGLALGLSILTKGLVGVAFVGLFAICVAAWHRQATRRLAAMLTAAGVLAVLVALPWYFLMERAHPGYLHYYFIERHLQGYLTATQRHAGRPWWYYVPVVLGGALPWTGFIPAAVRLKSRTQMLLWAWFVSGFVFLSISGSKLVTYVIPALPALAIAIAAAVVKPRESRALHAAGIVTHAVALASLPATAVLVIRLKFGELSAAAVTAAASAAALVVLMSIRARQGGTPTERLSRLTATTVVGLFATVVIAAPQATSWMTSRDLADTLNSGGALPPKVLVLDERIGSLIFYLSPALRSEVTPERVTETTMPEAIEQVRGDQSEWLLAVRARSEPRVRRLLGNGLQPDARAGTFVIYRASTLRRALEYRR